jgi:AraC-like DNA-binding protein
MVADRCTILESMSTGDSQRLHDARKAMEEKSPSVSEYREYLPPVALREHVLCFWTQSIQRSDCNYSHRVLPDACLDLVFFEGQSPAVIGPWTESFIAQLAPGTRITGVRFHPGRAAAILGLPASELINQEAALGDIWKAALREPFARLDESSSFRSRRFALEAALLRHLRNVAPPDATVGSAIRWLARNPCARIEELSQLAGISSRQLQRRFSAAVGYGPKMFQSVLRFQRLLYLASRSAGECGLADLAARSGYADQSHMNREVRRFAGKSPGELLSSAGSTLKLTDLVAPGRDGDAADFAA